MSTPPPNENEQVQDAVLRKIRSDRYEFEVPELDTAGRGASVKRYGWKALGHPDTPLQELKRIEAEGDAVLNAAITLLICDLFPDGNAHERTVIGSAVKSNKTFACLVEKLVRRPGTDRVRLVRKLARFDDAFLPLRPPPADAPPADPDRPLAADIFEIVVGAYYHIVGFTRLRRWVKETFAALVIAAQKAFVKAHRPSVSIRDVRGSRALDELPDLLAGMRIRSHDAHVPERALRPASSRNQNSWFGEENCREANRRDDRAASVRFNNGENHGHLLDPPRNTYRSRDEHVEYSGYAREVEPQKRRARSQGWW